MVYALTLEWASLQSPKHLAKNKKNKQEELNQPRV